MNTSSRSNTVHGLSGKVTGLKFMQRGLQQQQQQQQQTQSSPAPSAAPSTPRATSSSAAGKSNRFAAIADAASPALSSTSSFGSPAAQSPGGPASNADAEQWVVPLAKRPKIASTSTSNTAQGTLNGTPAKFQHEAGWDAWLLEREKHDSATASTSSSSSSARPSSARRTFGVFPDQEPEQREPQEDDDESDAESGSSDDDSDDDRRGQPHIDDSGDEGARRPSARKGGPKKEFLKPGSLAKGGSGQSSSGKVKSSASSSSSGGGGSGSRKKQDEIITARKKAGGISSSSRGGARRGGISSESQRQGSRGSGGVGDKGGDERAPWQKVLWRPQPYPDNYVPPSFLDQLRTNTSIRLPTLAELVLSSWSSSSSQVHSVMSRRCRSLTSPVPPRRRSPASIRLPTLAELVLSSLPISQQFLTTMLFVSTFIHLYSGLVTAPSLLVVSLSASMLAWTTVRVRDWAESSLQRWHRTSSAEPSGPRRTRLQRRRRQQGRRDTNPVLGLVILGFVLLSLSPVLKTLTEATTSDSIWALSTLLFSLHLVLADYRLPPPPPSPSPPCTWAPIEAADGGGGAGTEGFTSGPPRTLASTLSLNAAVCGSVVLASRLGSDEEVFALVLFAGILFGLGPIWQKRLLSPVEPTACATTATAAATTTTTRTATLVVYTLLLYATVMASLLPLDTRAPAAFTSLAVAFVSGLCPAWMRWAQRWKMEIKGPWDPAVPVLSNRGRGG